MKFIKWVKSLFIPTECLTEPAPPAKHIHNRADIMDSDVIARLLWGALTNVYPNFPETKDMSPNKAIEFVLKKFQEQYPTAELTVIRNDEVGAEFIIIFNGKRIKFDCEYKDQPTLS